MTASVACPHCRTTHSFPDGMVGKRARCRQCLNLFMVSALAGVGTPVDDVDTQEQSAKVKPAPPRRRYADDYGPEPVRRSGGNGLLIGLLVGCGAFLLVLVLGGVAVAAFLYFSLSEEPGAAPAPRPAAPAPPAPRPPDPFPPARPPARPAAPPKKPAQPEPPAKPAFTLSNAKVETVRNVPTVVVDCRPDTGPPAAGQQFFLLIRSAGGGVYRSSQLSHLRLKQQNTLRIRLPRAMNDPGPFELNLRMGRLGMADEGESVSNTISTAP
jgi:hypothetical protein